MPSIDPDIEAAIRSSFARQGFNATLGAELTRIAAGEVDIGLAFSPHLTQQNGFLHAGVVTSLADNACGYAAMSLASADQNPLAVEFKISLLSPAIGDRFEARARVVRRGKTLTVVQADVFAISSAGEQRIATLLETVILRSGEPSR